MYVIQTSNQVYLIVIRDILRMVMKGGLLREAANNLYMQRYIKTWTKCVIKNILF